MIQDRQQTGIPAFAGMTATPSLLFLYINRHPEPTKEAKDPSQQSSNRTIEQWNNWNTGTLELWNNGTLEHLKKYYFWK